MTSNKQTYFIGIDVHLSRFTAACLDENLQILFVDDFSLDELIDRLGSVSPQIIAVDAPLGLNIGLMDDEHYRRKLGLKSDKHRNKKVSEYELTRRGISLYTSPKDEDSISGWKSWMGTGLQLFEGIKQISYIHVNVNNTFDKGIVEVFPHASFTVLAGKLLENKSTEAGLQERVQVLKNVGVCGTEKFLSGSKHAISDKLDAIIAAYTAYIVWNGQSSFIGDPGEGCIALPVKELKDKYTKGKISVEAKNETVLNVDSFDLGSLIYTYNNVDAVVWLKHFVPVGDSPLIYDVINFKEHPDLKVKLTIESEQGNLIGATFEAMKNRFDGMKVVQVDKQKLKEFWGSHGDKREYQIKIINKVSA